MRKLVVKIFNLVFLAAAAVSIWAFCTRPIFKATLDVSLSKEKMSEIVSKAFSKSGSSESGESEGEGGTESKVVYRAEMNVNDFLTPEKIGEYFPDGYKLSVPIQIPAKYAFQLQNQTIISTLYKENIYSVVDNVVESLMTPVHALIKDAFKAFASQALEEEINKQIAENFPDGEVASKDEVDAVFNNVYALFETGEEVKTEDLADAILNGNPETGEGGILDIINARGARGYSLWDPQPTQEEVAADITAEGDDQKYFVVGEPKLVHNSSSYESSTEYRNSEGNVWVPQPTQEEVEADINASTEEQKYFVYEETYVHNTEAYSESTQYYKKDVFNKEDVDMDAITYQMTAALESVDGVNINATLCDPQPTQAEVEEDIAKEESKKVYYVLDENGKYVFPTEYSATATYYTVEKTIKDLDTAIDALLQMYLKAAAGEGEGGSENSAQSSPENGAEGSEGTKAVYRETQLTQENADDEDTISSLIREFVLKMIPFDATELDAQVGQYVPYGLFALVMLGVFPWALFALVTFIRTLRKKKCWTKPWIVFVFAFMQLIFGVVLTYGVKYAMPMLSEVVPAEAAEYLGSVSLDLRTGCLIPSFIYLGMIPVTIAYIIVCHPVKKEWKQEKRLRRAQLRERKKAA